jgi:glycosyltransferase involved in cell wall biosynthesis
VVHATVSVIIPTYNRAHLVCEAIDSVLGQTFTDYEIIVVDDGSKDETQKCLKQRYYDRIRYVYQTNAGRSAARNKGVELAAGRYVAFLDSDDVWLRAKLERMIPFMMDGGFDFAGHKYDYLRDGLRVSNDHAYGPLTPGGLVERPRHAMLSGTFFQTSTYVCTRDLFQRSGGFATCVEAAEDTLWAWQASTLGRTGFLPETLSLFRLHGHQTDWICSSTLSHYLDVLKLMLATTSGDPGLARNLRTQISRKMLQFASALRAEGRTAAGTRIALQALRTLPTMANVLRLGLYGLGRDFRRQPRWHGILSPAKVAGAVANLLRVHRR